MRININYLEFEKNKIASRAKKQLHILEKSNCCF